MEQEVPKISLRGRPVAAGILGLCFLAIFLSRFLPSYLPDYSGLLSIPREAQEALGCLDYETSQVLSAIYDLKDVMPGQGEWLLAQRNRALEAAGRLEHAHTCLEELAVSAPYLVRDGELEKAFLEFEQAFVGFYGAATSVALAQGNDTDALIARREAAWKDVEAHANAVHGTIAKTQ